MNRGPGVGPVRAKPHSSERNGQQGRFLLGWPLKVGPSPTVFAGFGVRAILLVVAALSIRRYSAADPGVQIEAVGALLVLSALSWWAARPGPIGPAAPGGVARVLRAASAAVWLGVLAWFLSEAAGGASHDPAGWWIAAVVVVTCWAAGSAVTSAGVEPRTLRVVLALAAAAVLSWGIPFLYVDGFRQAVLWPVLVIWSAATVAWMVSRRSAPGQGMLASTGVVLASTPVIFLAAAGYSHVMPQVASGDRVDLMDPMVGVLVQGAVLGVLLLAVRATLRQSQCLDVKHQTTGTSP